MPPLAWYFVVMGPLAAAGIAAAVWDYRRKMRQIKGR